MARLVPIEAGKRVLTPEQQAARARALERMQRGIDLGEPASGSIATRCMSAERYSIDTNILVYSVDRREGEKHLRALDIMERSVDLDCVLTAQALAEFVVAATRRRMLSKPHAIAQARDWGLLFPVVTASALALDAALHRVRSRALRPVGRPPAGDRARRRLHDRAERGHAGRRRARWCHRTQSAAWRRAAGRSAAAARDAVG